MEPEKIGRASSRKEKGGMGEESSTPKEPGTAGEGGCGDAAHWAGCSSAKKEAGTGAEPLLAYSSPARASGRPGCESDSTAGATKMGLASARNENGASAEPPPWPERPADEAGTETALRVSGAIDRSGVEPYEPD